MNKLFKTALAAVMVLSMALPVFAEPSETDENTAAPNAGSNVFSDINTENFAWAKPYILNMHEKGLVSGYEDGTYRPDNDVTRQEALSLFARAMGSNDPVNAEVLQIAHDRYDELISNYALTWGKDEIAYLMYKGALKKVDLDTYLLGDEKKTPMKRYEAAIIITKAMGGEEKALADLGVVLDYNDARDVPSNAIQYVAYASDAGIMEGMGDGTFSPNTAVKRSQIAVMLSRTVDKTEYEFISGTLTAIDTGSMTISIKNDDDEDETYSYTGDTSFKTLGDETQPSAMAANMSVVVTLSGGTAVSVDTVSDLPSETVVGKYVNYATNSGVTSVRITLDETGETMSYECLPDLSVMYQGSPATVRSFVKGDVLELELKNGKIAKISGNNKTVTISGAVVENIDISDGVHITISHGDDEYNGKTYEVSSVVSVRKNDVTSGLDSIYPGDKVKLTLEYDVVTEIRATSTTKSTEGTIKSLTIASPDSTITLNINGEEKTYTIPKDVVITVNGEEGSLYDFRVGDIIKINTDSDAITKITATSTQESSGDVTGVVTAINTSFGVVSVKVDGSEIPVNVFCKDDTTTFVGVDGKSKKMKDVQVGQTVEVKGTVSNGAFVGKLFIIIAEAAK